MISSLGNHRNGVARKGEGKWWSNPHEVIAFARILVEAEQLGACQHMVISFFEQPWAWDREHAVWCANDRPDKSHALLLMSRFRAATADSYDRNEPRSKHHGGHGALRWRDWRTA